MEPKIFKTYQDANWTEHTLIVASISVGNISQLAIDLLISTLPGTTKAGFVSCPYIEPLIGFDAFAQNSSDLTLGCELYENKALKLVIIQQRAPFMKGGRSKFLDLLVNFINQENFKETICLTSSHAYERIDSQLSGDQFRFLYTGDLTESLSKLNWKQLEKRLPSDLNHNELQTTQSKPTQREAFIPGGGIAEKLFLKLKEQGKQVYVMIVFAHEGNNIPEAIQLVNRLNEWKDLLEKCSLTSWRLPISWKYVFGRSMDPQMLGNIF